MESSENGWRRSRGLSDLEEDVPVHGGVEEFHRCSLGEVSVGEEGFERDECSSSTLDIRKVDQ